MDFEPVKKNNLFIRYGEYVNNFSINNIVKDKDILQHARFTAKQILKNDPSLSQPENRVILNTYRALSKYKNIWNYIN